MNMYKPAVKVYLGDKFIGYFSNKQQFDEVYNALVTEKQQIDPNVKVYLESDPTFQTSYIRGSLLASQNIYTNLRAEIKTEFTVYDVAVNGENKMTFNTSDEANKYASDLKGKVTKLNVEVKSEKVNNIDNTTSIDTANNILNDIVDRNQPVELPKATVSNTTTTSKKTSTNTTAKASSSVASTAAAQGGIWPTVSRYISCRFGWRPEFGDFHTGTDIAGHAGDPIYAYKSGTVIFAGWGGSYGNLVKIDHGNGFQTWYAHNSKILVSVGQTVSQGQTISLMGMTGFATGNHLHFEVRLNGVPVDSYNYIVGK